MKTTVVVATYNGEKYIKKQLISIIKQSVLPDQIVITDDGSTDNTLEIVKELKESNPSINWSILKNEHLGFIGNYLNGLNAAKCDLVFLSDQDDQWEKDKIAKHIKIYENKEALLVHGEIDIVNLEGKVIVQNSQGYKNGVSQLDFRKFLKKPNYPGMSLSFKNSFFKEYKSFFCDYKEAIKTHDYILVMLAVLNDGAYSLGESYNKRTATGENVAMNDDPTAKTEYLQRLRSASVYKAQMRLLRRAILRYGLHNSDLKLVNDVESFQQIRFNYLKNFSMLTFVRYVSAIRKLSNIKTYIGDTISILKSKFNR